MWYSSTDPFVHFCQRRAALDQQWRGLEQACQQQDDARVQLATSWQQVRADLLLAISLFLLVLVLLLGSGLCVPR